MLGRVLICCALCLALLGCQPAANPGTWDQAKIEEHLKKKHGLQDISLLPKVEGGFTGSGRTKWGETYRFKVAQKAEQKQLSWDFESDRGAVGSEVYEFVNAE